MCPEGDLHLAAERFGNVRLTSKQDMETQTLNMDFFTYLQTEKNNNSLLLLYNIPWHKLSFLYLYHYPKNQYFSCYVIPKSQSLLAVVVMTILLLGGQRVHCSVWGLHNKLLY